MAYTELAALVENITKAKYRNETATIRKDQVGSGMRGDKVRTIRFQDNTVVDHQTGKKMQADKFMKGFIDELWN